MSHWQTADVLFSVKKNSLKEKPLLVLQGEPGEPGRSGHKVITAHCPQTVLSTRVSCRTLGNHISEDHLMLAVGPGPAVKIWKEHLPIRDFPGSVWAFYYRWHPNLLRKKMKLLRFWRGLSNPEETVLFKMQSVECACGVSVSWHTAAQHVGSSYIYFGITLVLGQCLVPGI